MLWMSNPVSCKIPLCLTNLLCKIRFLSMSRPAGIYNPSSVFWIWPGVSSESCPESLYRDTSWLDAEQWFFSDLPSGSRSSAKETDCICLYGKSHSFGHCSNHTWGLECKSSGKSRASPSGSAPSPRHSSWCCTDLPVDLEFLEPRTLWHTWVSDNSLSRWPSCPRPAILSAAIFWLRHFVFVFPWIDSKTDASSSLFLHFSCYK